MGEAGIEGVFGKGQRLPNVVAQRCDRVTQTVVARCMAERLQTFIEVVEGRDIKTKPGKKQRVTVLTMRSRFMILPPIKSLWFAPRPKTPFDADARPSPYSFLQTEP